MGRGSTGMLGKGYINIPCGYAVCVLDKVVEGNHVRFMREGTHGWARGFMYISRVYDPRIVSGDFIEMGEVSDTGRMRVYGVYSPFLHYNNFYKRMADGKAVSPDFVRVVRPNKVYEFVSSEKVYDGSEGQLYRHVFLMPSDNRYRGRNYQSAITILPDPPNLQFKSYSDLELAYAFDILCTSINLPKNPL